MPKDKVSKLLLPEDAYQDVRFHRKLLDRTGHWPDIQRVAFLRHRFDGAPLRRVVYDLDIPKISVRILIFYAEADICFTSLLYCIRTGRLPRIKEAETLYKILHAEEMLTMQKMAGEKKDAIFDNIKKRIANIPEKNQAGG